MKIVVLTGPLFLANLAGLLHGKGFSVSRLATGILTVLFIALNKVNWPSPHPNAIYFRSANTLNYSESDRMVSKSADLSLHSHRPVQMEHYDQLR